jgi:hypothetical protein
MPNVYFAHFILVNNIFNTIDNTISKIKIKFVINDEHRYEILLSIGDR